MASLWRFLEIFSMMSIVYSTNLGILEMIASYLVLIWRILMRVFKFALEVIISFILELRCSSSATLLLNFGILQSKNPAKLDFLTFKIPESSTQNQSSPIIYQKKIFYLFLLHVHYFLFSFLASYELLNFYKIIVFFLFYQICFFFVFILVLF